MRVRSWLVKNRLMHFSLSVVLISSLWAADVPPVPDPYGLGERLALIDHLNEVYGEHIEPGTTLKDLRAQYLTAWTNSHSTTEIPMTALERDEAQRLRYHLKTEYGYHDLDQTSLADLREWLSVAEGKATVVRELDVAAAVEKARQRPERELPAPPIRTEADPIVAQTEPVRSDALARNETSVPSPKRWQTKELPLPEGTFRRVLTWQREGRAMLAVQMGDPGGLDFDGACYQIAALIGNSPAPFERGIFIIGHGTGVSVGDQELDEHLKRYKYFYETLGGTAERKNVECLILASCSKGGSIQMRTIRDGLGYLPKWRVATGHRTFANLPTVFAAAAAVLQQDGSKPYRGSFRWSDEYDAASTGEVGSDSKTGNLLVFRVSVTGGQLVVEPQR